MLKFHSQHQSYIPNSASCSASSLTSSAFSSLYSFQRPASQISALLPYAHNHSILFQTGMTTQVCRQQYSALLVTFALAGTAKEEAGKITRCFAAHRQSCQLFFQLMPLLHIINKKNSRPKPFWLNNKTLHDPMAFHRSLAGIARRPFASRVCSYSPKSILPPPFYPHYHHFSPLYRLSAVNASISRLNVKK